MDEMQQTNKSAKNADNPEDTTNTKRKMATWKKIVFGVVAFVVVIIVLASLATSGPAKASDEFVDNILSGNSEAAYSAFSTEAKDVVAKDQFDQLVVQMDEVLDAKATQKSKEVEGETGSAATGTVVYEVNGSDGKYVLTVNLVKEDDVWKVLNFDNSLKD